MTDNEIIKALEYCTIGNHCRSDCPYDCEDDSCIECTSKLAKDALALINRQKAEIERLQKEKFNSLNSQFAEMYATTLKIATKKVKSEAIKKFAHQLKILLETKATLYSLSDKECEFAIVQSTVLKTIDNLVKEMTEKE